jgi:hypothetical protein
MRRTLIALATVGVVASGAAVACSTGAQLNTGIVPVQYSSHDRWDDRSVSVNEREARIRARIEHGMNDGRITRPEARRLLRQLAFIESKEHAYMADGRINRREEAQLTRDLDALAQNVRTQMLDEDRSYSYYTPYRR